MKLYFKVTDEFIKNELKRGNEVNVNQTIDIDFSSLTEEQRELILKHCSLNSEEKELYAGFLQCSDGWGKITKPERAVELDGLTINAILETFKKFDIIAESKKAKDKKGIENNINEFIVSDGRSNLWGESFYSDFSGTVDIEKLKIRYNSETENYGQLAFNFEEIEKTVKKGRKLKVEREQKEREKKERREKELKAESDRLEKQKRDLQQWALTNGSELVKLRIKHEQNWVEIAEFEWALHYFPDFGKWMNDESDNEWEIKDGSVEQLKILDEMNEKYKDYECFFILERHEFVSNYPEDDSEIVDFIAAYIQTPYRKVTLYKEI